jgi:hypothetical protein
VNLHTMAGNLTVYPLDGTGARLPPLSAEHVQVMPDGFRIHIQAEGQDPSPWYELVSSSGATGCKGPLRSR